jgi:hypothetical protein
MNGTDRAKLREWYTIYRQSGKNEEALDHIAHLIWDIVEKETKSLRSEKLRKKRRVIRALEIMEELRTEYTEA